MKNSIIILLFLITSTSLFAVNKDFEKKLNESSTELVNNQFVDELKMPIYCSTFLPANCIIDITLYNSDGERTAHIHIETNTETAAECDSIRDAVLDMATE